MTEFRTRFLSVALVYVFLGPATASHAEEAVTSAGVNFGKSAETTQIELSEWIDRQFDAHFVATGKEPFIIIDDAAFLRRVYLDLAGRIPLVAELRDFLNDDDPGKRLRIIDRLLEDDGFQEHTARVWRRILIPVDTAAAPGLSTAMESWLELQLAENVPYDQLVRMLVVAGGAEPRPDVAVGSVEGDPSDSAVQSERNTSPTAFLLTSGGQPAAMASSVSRVFLGVRMECAQCHDHPFTDWTQQDFWGLAAFFSGARLNPAAQAFALPNQDEQQPLVDERTTTISDEEGNSYSVSLPWTDAKAIQVPDEAFPRAYFAEWLTSPENPHFAATAVNRVWQHLCGNGLTDSVDDLDQAPAEQRQIVLDGLAKKFAETGFDLKGLVRGICASRIYQRPSDQNQSEAPFDVRPLKVLTPEQVFDSLEIALGLPISRIDQGPRYNGERDALVARMEEALAARPNEFRSGIPQALALMNGPITATATDLNESRTLRAVVDAPFLDLYEKIDAMFLATLSRAPSGSEKQKFIEYVEARRSPRAKAEAFSEIMWALINSPEFVLVK